MLVCHCKRVHCRVIKDCVRAGARDVYDVAAQCGAATGCGGCRKLVEKLVEHEVGSARRCETAA